MGRNLNRADFYIAALPMVDPSQTLMIGDTSADYDVAIAAGVADFICIADNVSERDPAINPGNVIADLTGLPKLLLRRGDTLLRRNEG